MSDGFSNPIIGGGGALVYPSIHSPNFLHNTLGWSINKDGSAEFNNLVLRGTLDGTDYIINSAGAFFYNGTPAAGNLICSIAAVAGTDSFGNAYLAAVNSYSASALYTQLLSGAVMLASRAAATRITTPAIINVADAQADNLQPALLISGPATIAGNTPELSLFGTSKDGTAQAIAQITSTFQILSHLLVSTAAAATGALAEIIGAAAADSLWIPSGDIPVAAAPSGVENWHALPALQNSWANSGVNVAGQYRLIASPPRTVELIGDLTVGTVTDGTLITTLPANYRPANSQIVKVTVPLGTPTNPGNMRLVVMANGQIQCDGLAGLASPNRVYFHDFISLDA